MERDSKFSCDSGYCYPTWEHYQMARLYTSIVSLCRDRMEMGIPPISFLDQAVQAVLPQFPLLWDSKRVVQTLIATHPQIMDYFFAPFSSEEESSLEIRPLE